MAGLNLRTSKTLSLFVEGRWQQLSEVEIAGFDLSTSFPITAEIEFTTLSLRAGLSF